MADNPPSNAIMYQGMTIEFFRYPLCMGNILILLQFNDDQARFCMQWSRYIDDIYGNPDDDNDGTGFKHSSLGGILCLIAEHYVQMFPDILYVHRTIPGTTYNIEDLNESNHIREVGKVQRSIQDMFCTANRVIFQVVMDLIQGYTHAKSPVSFHTVWLEALNVVNAKHHAIPARHNPWVKSLLPEIYSRGKPSILLDSDVDE
jgi:hypothetical protein